MLDNLLTKDVPATTPDLTPERLLDVLFHDEGVLLRTNEFLRRENQTEVDSRRKMLVVLQGEMARVDMKLETAIYLASDEATTCIIAVAHCPVSALLSITHFDSSMTHQMVQQWLLGMKSPSIYLVGDYKQEKETWRPMTGRLLWYVRKLDDVQAKIQVACIQHLNTRSDGFPKTYALTYDSKNDIAYPVMLKGSSVPGDLQRRGKVWCKTQDLLSEIYTQGMIHVSSFYASPSRYLAYLLSLPNEELLRLCSTSPLHEKPSFPEDLRRFCQWMVSLQGEERNIPEQFYEWNETICGWVKTNSSFKV